MHNSAVDEPASKGIALDDSAIGNVNETFVGNDDCTFLDLIYIVL